MKTIKIAWIKSIELLASKPWLFCLLIPFFYMVSPAPHPQPLVFREFSKIVPAEVQPKIIQQEAELTKAFCSFSSTILLWIFINALQQNNKHFIED